MNSVVPRTERLWASFLCANAVTSRAPRALLRLDSLCSSGELGCSGISLLEPRHPEWSLSA